MTALLIIFLIEPVIYHEMLAAETGHAKHVLKTALYGYILMWALLYANAGVNTFSPR